MPSWTNYDISAIICQEARGENKVFDDREKINRFREIYRKEMLTREGISQVLYLGTTEGPKWSRGN